MRKVPSLSRLLAAAFFVSILAVSCQKDSSVSELSPQEEEEAYLSSAESEAQSEMIFDDVFNAVVGVNAQVGIGGTGIFSGRLAGDANVSREQDVVPGECFSLEVTSLTTTSVFPLRVVIDFGATGCLGRDGRTRYGKVITEYSGRLIEPGKSAVTTFEGYKVNGIAVSGTHTITNTGTANTREFTVDIANAQLTGPNGNYVQRTSHKVIAQVQGLATPQLPGDDVFSITGHASSSIKRGDVVTAWESEILEPLTKRFDCRWLVDGTVKTVRKSRSGSASVSATLDFGDGNCDNKATLTINGNSRQITLY